MGFAKSSLRKKFVICYILAIVSGATPIHPGVFEQTPKTQALKNCSLYLSSAEYRNYKS
jgi:hypothetical protein